MNHTSATGKLLRDARINKDLTQFDIASKLNISIQMVCDIEHGRRSLPDKYIDKWAATVGHDPDLIAIDLWQRRLDEFNKARGNSRKIFFKIVPILDQNKE